MNETETTYQNTETMPREGTELPSAFDANRSPPDVWSLPPGLLIQTLVEGLTKSESPQAKMRPARASH